MEEVADVSYEAPGGALEVHGKECRAHAPNQTCRARVSGESLDRAEDAGPSRARYAPGARSACRFHMGAEFLQGLRPLCLTQAS